MFPLHLYHIGRADLKCTGLVRPSRGSRGDEESCRMTGGRIRLEIVSSGFFKFAPHLRKPWWVTVSGPLGTDEKPFLCSKLSTQTPLSFGLLIISLASGNLRIISMKNNLAISILQNWLLIAENFNPRKTQRREMCQKQNECEIHFGCASMRQPKRK